MAWSGIFKDNNSTYILFYKEPKFASMNIPFYQVDAFSHHPFKGNPAGVCLLDTPITDHLLRSIAAENNHLEIAFLLTTSDGYNLRWFSPRMEMPLCGHATLATAHILWELGLEPKEKMLQFQTLSGTLTAAQQDGWIQLDLPARPGEQRPVPTDLQTLFPHRENIIYSVDRYIVELSSAAEVMDFVPDTLLLKDHRCVITSRGEEGSPYDFISRYFAIPVGFIEDPVTGTAHCSLAPYWADRLGKQEFFAYQASPRGGELKVTLKGNRVLLSGEAVTIMDGKIVI
jgi:predicted PhzF superfamily epimerase YddE/YHI9